MINTNIKPKALALADELMQAHDGHSDEGPTTFSEAAIELRYLHQLNEDNQRRLALMNDMQRELVPVAVASMPHCRLEWLIGDTVTVEQVAEMSCLGTKLYAVDAVNSHQQPVATVTEVHMSRYTIEWTNGPLPEGTQLYTTPQYKHPPPPTALSSELPLKLEGGK